MVQHGDFCGEPITKCTRSSSKSAQTPSLRVSLGHLGSDGCCLDGVGLWGLGGGGGQGT